MLKPLLPPEWRSAKPLLLISALLVAPGTSVLTEGEELPKIIVPGDHLISIQPALQMVSAQEQPQELEAIEDPLNSPFPIPWSWVTATFAELETSGNIRPRYFRSPTLISPDGRYAAYSRISMQTGHELYTSRASSVMFLENLETGELKTITASSPLANNPLNENAEARQPGAISILIPVSWSKTGDRLLARQFEGFFSTSDASDYAVIWERDKDWTTTIGPMGIPHSNAVLLGWSSLNPELVLFRAGNLGDENWPLWTVNLDSQTVQAPTDKPAVYGRLQQPNWTGPQAKW